MIHAFSDNYLQFSPLRASQHKYTNSTQNPNQDNHLSLFLTSNYKRRKKSFLLCKPKHLLCLCQQANPWLDVLTEVSRTAIADGVVLTHPPLEIFRGYLQRTFQVNEVGMNSVRDSWKKWKQIRAWAENSDSLLQCSNTALRWSIDTNK